MAKDINTEIVNELRSYMEKDGVSVNALAGYTQIPQTTLNRILNNQTELTLNRFSIICFSLDLMPEKVLQNVYRRITT